ncbi:MAG: hypothetical protein R2824_22905 [Saprospiraceae bacterium]
MRRLCFGLVALLILLVTGCTFKSEYREMVEENLASGIRQDSIFLGIYFGMDSKEFYRYCWEMNKKQLFLNGPSNNSVQYDISDKLKHPGKMNFYPSFYEDKIYEMPVEFAYDAFSWQDTYGVDSLLTDVLGMYEDWYGPFKEFTHPEKGSVFVNINGNRQIRLFKNNLNNSVNAVFTDLTVDKPKENKEKES